MSRQTLAAGDHLQVCICETESSEKIPPVKLPLNIVFMKMKDIPVINKPCWNAYPSLHEKLL
ncbi:MAG: hypothetical protein ACLUGJ_10025 [Blautia wexlerae]